MKTLLFALSLGLACLAHAEEAAKLPTTQVQDSPAFASIEEAAVAALKLVTEHSNRYEQGGMIIARDGQFYYTNPVTTKNTTALDFAVSKGKADQIVGIYHTHPGRGESNLERQGIDSFSAEDVGIAKRMKILSYIAVVQSRSIRFYDPSAAAYQAIPADRNVPGVVIAKLGS